MKFNYNFLTNTLQKLEGIYTYEVCENNYFRTPQGIYGTDGFHLGDNEWITFTFSTSNLKIFYQKGTNSYQKILDFSTTGEITFEFTDTDRINSS